VSEPEARHKLEGLRERIRHGESFAELAKLFSQDGSASKGGDLGWIYPGDTVPEFERAMNLTGAGRTQPAGPVAFRFPPDRGDRTSRAGRIERTATGGGAPDLRERKRDEAYQDWLRQARDRAYVEIRLEEG
jgi:peptidyl-prolyl cis-trans isomerase SurA